MNLEISVADGSASAVLAIVVTQLSIYLHIAAYHNHSLTTPILCLIIILSALFGAVQVIVKDCTKCVCEKATETEAEDENENDADDEAEDEDEAEPKAESENTNHIDSEPVCERPVTWQLPPPSPVTWQLPPPSPVTWQLPPEAPYANSRSLEQLREFAAKISEMNLKKLSEYRPDVLNPEDLLEQPRPSASPVVPETSVTEAVLESSLVADLVETESSS